MPIMPTPGRQVWYFGGHENPGEQVPEGTPLAATVAFVHPNGRINLQVIDSKGVAHSRLNVPLAQDDEVFNGAHAEWMPYQKVKAAEYATPAPVPSEFDSPPVIGLPDTWVGGVAPIVLPPAKKVAPWPGDKVGKA